MAHRELSVEDLYQSCELPDMDFTSTAELEVLRRPLGQERAVEAIEFGVDIRGAGFNLFALGPPGVGKHQLVTRILSERSGGDAQLWDWCYVSNFSDPQRPRLLRLEPGLGNQLREDMLQLVEDLLTALPSSFQDQEYSSRRQEIEEEVMERYEEAFSQLGAAARNKDVALVRTPAGYTLAPLRDGNIISPEEFASLSKQEQEELQSVIADLQQELQKVISQMPMLKREVAHRIKALNREITQGTVEQFVAWLENKYREHEHIIAYIDEVKDFAIDNAEEFMPQGDSDVVENAKQRAQGFSPFKVNVIVDNTGTSGRPVVFEENPTFQNLVGRVEYISQMGTLLTDFTLIRAGALHRANGGYLIIEADQLLRHLYAWEGLKQSLKSGEVKITSLQERLSLNSTLSLEPETMPLEIKVILLGEPYIYYLLNHYDPEFGKLFRVAADFAYDTPSDPENQRGYAQMIAALQQQSELLPLEKDAVCRVIEQAAREADDSEKLSLDLESLNRLLQESDHWARERGAAMIARKDIEEAISRERRRHGQLQERMGEQVVRGIRLIDTDGSKVAQVNGLSVLQLGSHSFGAPTRITATARLGSGKVIDIEREAKLGGAIHSKGVMILSAYLADRFAQEKPLPLAASLVFEQSYGGVDGDSASCAELCVLLSAIARIPLNQSLAVTGSMNQLGEVQAIGGVNEKVEGFFEICQSRGLTGEQGVIVPAANAVHLMLRRDIRDAVEAGSFHLYTAEHVDDVMELLSGMPAGEADGDGNYPEGCFNALLAERFSQLQGLQEAQRSSGDKQDETSEQS